MPRATRREFLRSSAAVAALGLPNLVLGFNPSAKGDMPNDQVRIGIVGLGDVNAVGGVGGRGHQLINAIGKVPGARIVALCDIDRGHLDRETAAMKKRGAGVATYHDIRKLLDDKNRRRGGRRPAESLARPGNRLGLSGGQGRLRGKAALLQHLGRPANGRRCPQAWPHGPGGHAKPLQSGLAAGLPVSSRRPARRNPLCPRARLPPADRHWQSRPAHAGARHGRLRSLVRPGPKGR